MRFQTSRDLRKLIAKAHCSVAEIFLTDLCFEECAEQNCEREVGLALQTDPQSLDGLQTLASLRLSQSRRAEAAAAIEQVYGRLVAIRDVVRARTVVEELRGAEEPAEFGENPEFEFCIATAKLLVECCVDRPLFANVSIRVSRLLARLSHSLSLLPVHLSLSQHAVDLVSDLLQDDDENVELWYLAGVAALSCSPPDTQCALVHLEHALQMMTRIRDDCRNSGEEVGAAKCRV